MVVLNAHLYWKVDQGDPVSTTFTNLEDTILNISITVSNLVYFNLKTICTVSPHGLAVHQVSTPFYMYGSGRSDQNWRSCADDKSKNKRFQQ